eukprot:scaffold112482_cov19-Tisochrysis_lutea.AAC.1
MPGCLGRLPSTCLHNFVGCGWTPRGIDCTCPSRPARPVTMMKCCIKASRLPSTPWPFHPCDELFMAILDSGQGLKLESSAQLRPVAIT